MENYRWRNAITTVILVVGSIAFHSCNLGFASYDLDEAVHIWHAQKSFGEVVIQSANDPNPPVYNLIMSSWVKLFGVDEWTVRFLSVLMGSLAVGLMFFFVKRNYCYRIGVMAAILFCFAAVQFRFTHLARPYALLMVAVIASYGLLLDYFRYPSKKKLLLYYLFTTLMIYVHPTAIFNIPAQGLLILLTYRNDLKQLLIVLGAAFVSVVTFGAWYLIIPYFDTGVGMWFDPPNFDDIWYVLQVLYGSWKIIVLQLLLLIIISVRYFLSRDMMKWIDIVVGIVWILVPIASSIVFSHLFKPVFQDKYVLSSLPGIILLLVVSIDQAFERYWKLLPFVLALVISITSIRTEPYSEGNWRQLVGHIRESYDENTCVFIHPWYELRTFAFYFDRDAYKDPYNTEKDLVKNRVFTAWHDVVPEGSQRAVVDKIQLITAHGDFAKVDSLNKVCNLIDSKLFSGIRLNTYLVIRSGQYAED